jgi:hypothetical protein
LSGGACVPVGIDYHGGARGTLWCRSTILRASRPMPGFHSRPDVGDAILDRLVHNAYRRWPELLTPSQHRRCTFRYRNRPLACRRQLRVPEQHFLKRSSAPPLSSLGDEARRLRPARRPAVVHAGGVSSSSLYENPRTRRRILRAWRNAALINGHQCFPAPGRL